MDEKLKAHLAQCESQASEEKVLSDYYGGWFDGECPEFPLEDWLCDVRNNYTREGYWTWVLHGLQDKENEK